MTGVPDAMASLSKPEIAIELLKTARANDGPCRPVVADAGYGDSRDFRESVRALGLHYVVAVSSNTTVRVFATVGAGGNSTTTFCVLATAAKTPSPGIARGHHWRCRSSSFVWSAGCTGAIASRAQRYRVLDGRGLPRV